MAITPDNIPLSEPTPIAAATAAPIGIACTDATVLHFIEAATAPNTRRAYDSDLKHFLAWGGALPASPEDAPVTWQPTPRPMPWPPLPATWSQSGALTPYEVCLTQSGPSSFG